MSRVWPTNPRLLPRLQTDRGSSSSGSFSSDASLEEIRNSFKVVFDSIKDEGDSIVYMFETVRREIRELIIKRLGKKL